LTNKVISGTYADFKIVKTRNVAQFVVEIPLEQADAAIQMFGVPKVSVEQWVAIAALKEAAVVKTQEGADMIKLAAMLCSNPEFGVFLRDAMRLSEVDPTNSESVASGLRKVLGVKSRTEFHDDSDARLAFSRLKGEYDKWLAQRW
jgi:hypothetical protein